MIRLPLGPDGRPSGEPRTWPRGSTISLTRFTKLFGISPSTMGSLEPNIPDQYIHPYGSGGKTGVALPVPQGVRRMLDVFVHPPEGTGVHPRPDLAGITNPDTGRRYINPRDSKVVYILEPDEEK